MHSHPLFHPRFIFRGGILLATALLGFTTSAPAQPAPARAGAAPSASDLTVLDHALRTVIEQQDPSTKDIFDKNPTFRLIRAPFAPAPAAAAPAATIARDGLPFTPSTFAKVNPNLPTLVVAGDSTA
jgi:hypothetical protein